MSPLFAAMPPADLPTNAYVAPIGVHATAPLTTNLTMASGDKTYTVASGDTVYDIAERHDASPQDIVRANSLPRGGRMIMPGDTLRIPTGAAEKTTPARSSTSSPSGSSVTVRAGDTLSDLAIRHGVTITDLVSANSITNSRLIYPGQTLVLNAKKAERDQPSTSSQSRSGTGSSTSDAARSTSTSITVRAGDTLWGLAASHGVSVSALAKANDLTTARLIHPGQTLNLPGSASSASSSGSTRAAASPSPSSSAPSSSSTKLTQPYDENTIGDIKAGEAVADTFLHYRYSDGVARAAAANREYLASADAPSQDAIRQVIVQTSTRYGVDPDLMVALSFQESGWNQRAVSPANAIGAMQVIPTSGEWASSLVGRELNLLDPQDNVTAGVVIMAALQRSADSADDAIGGYYQGLGSVRQYGLFSDTEQYVSNIRQLMKTQ